MVDNNSNNNIADKNKSAEEILKEKFSPMIKGKRITLTEELHHILNDFILEIHDNYKFSLQSQISESHNPNFYNIVNQEQWNIQNQEIRNKLKLIKELKKALSKNTEDVMIKAVNYIMDETTDAEIDGE